jgi:hypothetical protein
MSIVSVPPVESPARAIPSEDPRPVPHPGRLRALAMAAAVLSGLATWLIHERTGTVFVPRPRPVRAAGRVLNRPSFESRATAELRNAAVAFGVFGAGFALAMGLTGGFWRAGPRAALSAGASGLLLGGAAGGAASVAVLPAYYHKLDVDHEALSHDLVLPFLVHGGIWSSVGATAGVAFGLAIESRRRLAAVATRGLIGGLLGAAIYEVVAALAFPIGRTTEPLSGARAPRLIGWLIVAAVSAAFFVPAALSSGREDRPPRE